MKKLLVLFLIMLSIVSLMGCQSSQEEDKDIFQKYELDFPDSSDEIECVVIRASAGEARVVLDMEIISDIYNTVTSLDGKFIRSTEGIYGSLYHLKFYTIEGEEYWLNYSGGSYSGSSSTLIGRYGPMFRLSDDKDEALYEFLNNVFENAQTSFVYTPELSCELVTETGNQKIELSDEEQQQIADIFNGYKKWSGDMNAGDIEYVFVTGNNYTLYYNYDIGLLRDKTHHMTTCVSDEDRAIINNILGIEE